MNLVPYWVLFLVRPTEPPAAPSLSTVLERIELLDFEDSCLILV